MGFGSYAFKTRDKSCGTRYGRGRSRLTNSYPLRRVVRAYVNEYGGDMEDLECGHSIHTPRDLVGLTVAARRRCAQCARAAAEREGTNDPTDS